MNCRTGCRRGHGHAVVGLQGKLIGHFKSFHTLSPCSSAESE